jgi:hypothetical protein
MNQESGQECLVSARLRVEKGLLMTAELTPLEQVVLSRLLVGKQGKINLLVNNVGLSGPKGLP